MNGSQIFVTGGSEPEPEDLGVVNQFSLGSFPVPSPLNESEQIHRDEDDDLEETTLTDEEMASALNDAVQRLAETHHTVLGATLRWQDHQRRPQRVAS